MAALLAVPGVAAACDLTGFYDQGVTHRSAGALPVGGPEVQAVPASCPQDPADTDPIQPDQSIEGEFGTDLERSYVLLPFDVPAGTTAVRVKYCYDQPDVKPPNSPIGNTLDLGLYEARSDANDPWDEDEFRGWGGSSHPDVTVSENGFSSEAAYVAHPRTHVFGKTTRGFRPGAIRAGKWAVELGVAAVTSQLEGDADGKVAWRVEIELIDDPGYADAPYQPAPYDSTPANPDPGWYAGDMHVHSEHSSLGDATMTETFDFAFGPFAPGPDGGAGLDFITLSDYVTDTAWGEIGRYQGDHPGKLIVRSSEVITYRGHTNNHASVQFADYRTGPILVRGDGGALTQVRGPTPPSDIFDAVHAAGGWTQINHPTIFPSQVPGFDSFCRGCPWDYTNSETDYSKVDAIEIATGPAGLKLPPLDPGPNPFTPLALLFYENGLSTGAKIAAVGSSDSHKAGRTGSGVTDPITQAPIGQATTVVQAPELSESGIEQGVKAGHTYVKVFGNDGPDLRFEARDPGSGDPPRIMGDTIEASQVTFKARVLGAGPSAARPGPYLLLVFKDGLPLLASPVLVDDFSFEFPSLGLGRYRLQLHRLSGVAAIEAVSSPIYHEAAGAEPPEADLSVEKADSPDPVTEGQQLTYTLSVKNGGPDAAQNVMVGDLLPDGVSFESVNASQGSCSEDEGNVTCALGILVNQQTATVTIAVTPTHAGEIQNIAQVASPAVDPETDNSSDLETTDVRPTPGPCDGGRLGEDGENGDDELIGTNGPDRIRGLGGDDLIRGKRGPDCLNGDEGGDEVRGGRGRDELWGGDGDDEFFAVQGGNDTIHCGAGDDRVHAGRNDSVGASCERVTRGS